MPPMRNWDVTKRNVYHLWQFSLEPGNIGYLEAEVSALGVRDTLNMSFICQAQVMHQSMKPEEVQDWGNNIETDFGEKIFNPMLHLKATHAFDLLSQQNSTLFHSNKLLCKSTGYNSDWNNYALIKATCFTKLANDPTEQFPTNLCEAFPGSSWCEVQDLQLSTGQHACPGCFISVRVVICFQVYLTIGKEGLMKRASTL
ncbi:hypothetical protein CROQUDRAFT_136716, partial [Cronartium quercuum f. sp. fusiforme G11]